MAKLAAGGVVLHSQGALAVVPFGFFKKKAGGVVTLTISSNVANPNIRSLALAAGWDGASAVIVNITATLINTLQFTTSFPGGLTLNISASTRVGGVTGGGAAISTTVPISINNLGIISGGGGYGGNGQGTWSDYTLPATALTRSWGDAGLGGAGQGFSNSSSLTIIGASSGTAGGYASAGSGWAQGGNGGGGGAWGSPGAAGSYGSWSGVQGGEWTSLSGGGAGGLAVSGNSNVTWVATGTRVGGLA